MSRDATLNLFAEIQNLKRRILDLERRSGGLQEAGAGGLSVRGTPVLYSPVVYREYTVDGVLVAVGSETGAADRSLQLTVDWLRMHS